MRSGEGSGLLLGEIGAVEIALALRRQNVGLHQLAPCRRGHAATQIVAPQPFPFVNGEAYVIKQRQDLGADAAQIGESIRLKGFATLVVGNGRCASACALASRRQAEPRQHSRTARLLDPDPRAKFSVRERKRVKLSRFYAISKSNIATTSSSNVLSQGTAAAPPAKDS
jgi:hypothetical protein